MQLVDNGSTAVDAALELHRVVTRGDHLGALAEDRLGQHGRGGGAVTRDVGGLGSDLAHHLGAHVLELVFELDFLGHRHAVLGDGRGAEALLDHDVAALGAERDLHRVRQRVDARQDAIAGSCIEYDLFRSHVLSSLLFDDAEDVVLAEDQVVFTFDLDLGAAVLAEQDEVALLDGERPDLSAIEDAPGSHRDDLGLDRLFLGGIRNDDPAFGLSLLPSRA